MTSSRWKVMSTAPRAGVDAGALLDQAREPLRERDAAGLDPDEREVVKRRVALDDLVGDSRKGPSPALPRRGPILP